MAISVDGASSYFRSTTFHDSWAEYSQGQKEAALTMAKRDLSRALGRPLNEDEPPYSFGDTVREEFAAYEQALFSLLRDAQPKGGGSPVPSLDQDDQKAPAFSLASSKNQFSPRALSWLGRISTITRMGA